MSWWYVVAVWYLIKGNGQTRATSPIKRSASIIFILTRELYYQRKDALKSAGCSERDDTQRGAISRNLSYYWPKCWHFKDHILE